MLINNEDNDANNIKLNFRKLLTLTVNTNSSEIKLFNDVTVYDEEEITVIKQIETVVANYSQLYKNNNNIVNVLKLD